MICDKCKGQRFHSRYDRKTKDRQFYVCDNCGNEQNKAKKKKPEKIDNKILDNNEVQNVI